MRRILGCGLWAVAVLALELPVVWAVNDEVINVCPEDSSPVSTENGIECICHAGSKACDGGCIPDEKTCGPGGGGDDDSNPPDPTDPPGGGGGGGGAHGDDDSPSCGAKLIACGIEAEHAFRQCIENYETLAWQQCYLFESYPDGSTFENPYDSVPLNPWAVCLGSIVMVSCESTRTTYGEDCLDAWLDGKPKGWDGPTLTGAVGLGSDGFKIDAKIAGTSAPVVGGLKSVCANDKTEDLAQCNKDKQACDDAAGNDKPDDGETSGGSDGSSPQERRVGVTFGTSTVKR